MSLVLEAHALTRHYQSAGFFKRSAVKALNGVSFNLEAGKTLAIVGESGCGKSTLARILALLDQPTSGSLTLLGTHLAKASRAERRALRSKVQMVFQNPYASLNPRQSIQTQLEEPLKLNTSLNAAERLKEVHQMLEKVGLNSNHAKRYAHEFSGGQRQRIAIARAMILKPALLIADEPTAALDVSIQAQVLNLFQELQAQLGTAMVFISHNLPVVRYIADEIAVMYRGEIVEHGLSNTVYQKPLHPYTQMLLAATPSLNQPRRLEVEPIERRVSNAACTFAARCPDAFSTCYERAPSLAVFETRNVACHKHW